MTADAAPGGGDARTAIDDILARFVRYHPDRIDLSLDRMHRLLADLGDPHRALPPVIHVAGTNGKGSTVAFLAAALEAAGRTVSSYTSPHLVRFAERYRLAGRMPEDEALLALFEEVERANAGKAITEFEITTAAAFLAIARTPADFALLEVGLGGRYDATNVVEHPLATVITRIDMDHMAFLGDTLAEIAGEKAAIQKPGVPSIVAPQHPDALAVVTRAAQACGAPLHRAGTEWTYTKRPDGGADYTRGATAWRLPAPALPGEHQLANAATAAACLDVCALPGVTEDMIAKGLRSARWPGRLQRIEQGRLTAGRAEGWEVWLDAGHNPAGAEAAAATFAAMNEADPRPLYLVAGLLADKDIAGFLAAYAGLATELIAVPVPGAPAAGAPDALVRLGTVAGLECTRADSLDAALARIETARAPGRILVTGSHLLVGEALAANAAPR